jgi:hypothetical protein
MLPAVGKQWWPSRHRRFRRRGHKEVCGVAETETDHESGPDRRNDSDALAALAALRLSHPTLLSTLTTVYD